VVDDFEHQQFVVFRITPDNEEERGVPLVDDFRVLVLDEVTEFLLSTQNHVADFAN